MTTWNVNKDREFVDNLRLDYAAMDSITLMYARDMLRDDLFFYGREMKPSTRATKSLRLAIIEEILQEREA